MAKKQIKGLPTEVERVRGELDEWRGQRRQGQRIPEELWSGAVQAARRHGLNRVSRALGLDYYHLKRRSGLGEEKAQSAGRSEQAFVELASVATEATELACVVELEKGNGVRMRISVRDAATVDWIRMKEAFLGA
ncbi:MAG: hypothetical protein O2901_15475 [Verrucomicrobia bacterium]|nr:hypothetical protein [Verrucomicrobiota bacterium]